MKLRVPVRLPLKLMLPLSEQLGIGVRVTSWD
jgi:hypothetical protein